MAKHEHARTTAGSGAAGAGAAVAKAVVAAPEPEQSDFTPRHENIARLAYVYWHNRGCPKGSPDEDWLRAEAELRQQAAATMDSSSA